MFEQLSNLGLGNNIKLEKFIQLFLEYNQNINLVSKNDAKLLFEKHIYDSLAFNLFFQKYGKNISTLLDIGTGGGFPSIPIALFFNNIKVTAVDSTLKKIKFIEYIKRELEIDNLKPVCSRVEDLNCKAEFDICTSRAMAELRIILEYAIPYLKTGAFFAAYKSIKSDEEIKSAKNALQVLNAEIIDKIEYSLPLNEENKRVLLIVRKNAPTNEIYPRKNGLIIKRPL